MSKNMAIGTPVFLGHASDDEVIDISLGKQIHQILIALGVNVEWKEYSKCGHWLKEPDGFDDISLSLKEGRSLSHSYKIKL